MSKITYNTSGSKFLKKDGVYYQLSNETKPTATDGVNDGDSLIYLDTQQLFIYYKGVWREQ